MALHVFVFPLVVCLLLSLALLWRHDWFHPPLPPHEEEPSEARSIDSSSPAAQTIAPPAVSLPLPR
jgi:hypothetical protein